MTPAQFHAWKLAMGLTWPEAAAALGIHPRTAFHYAQGKYPVPRSVELACRQLEQEKANGNV
jgi:hypothetical protein